MEIKMLSKERLFRGFGLTEMTDLKREWKLFWGGDLNSSRLVKSEPPTISPEEE